MGSAFSDLLYLAIRKNVKLDDKLFRSRCFIDESTIQIGKNNKQVLQNNNSIDYSKFETKKLRNLNRIQTILIFPANFFPACLVTIQKTSFQQFSVFNLGCWLQILTEYPIFRNIFR